MQKGFAPIIIIAALLILAVVGASAYYFGQNSIQNKVTPFPIDGLSTQQPTPTTQSDETADWRTYTNDKFGVSFKHPHGWSVDAIGETICALPKPTIGETHSCFFVEAKGNITIDDLIKQNETTDNKFVKKEEMQIGSLKAVKITWNDLVGAEAPPGLYYTTVIQNGDETFSVGYETLNETHRKILSTLRFTN